jgi:hypothetical protein
VPGRLCCVVSRLCVAAVDGFGAVGGASGTDHDDTGEDGGHAECGCSQVGSGKASFGGNGDGDHGDDDWVGHAEGQLNGHWGCAGDAAGQPLSAASAETCFLGWIAPWRKVGGRVLARVKEARGDRYAAPEKRDEAADLIRMQGPFGHRGP